MKFYMVEIMLSILISIFDEAVWVKQALEKINQESQYG